MPPVEALTPPQRAAPYKPSPQAMLEARKPLDIILETHAAHLNKLQLQLGAALVFGNAIALFVLLQAKIAGRIAASEWLSAVFMRFTIGLGVALGAIAVTFLLGLFASFVLQSLSQVYVRMADAGAQAARATEANSRQTALNARDNASEELIAKHETALMAQMSAGLVVILYAISAGLFLWGLVDALNLQVQALP